MRKNVLTSLDTKFYDSGKDEDELKEQLTPFSEIGNGSEQVFRKRESSKKMMRVFLEELAEDTGRNPEGRSNHTEEVVMETYNVIYQGFGNNGDSVTIGGISNLLRSLEAENLVRRATTTSRGAPKKRKASEDSWNAKMWKIKKVMNQELAYTMMLVWMNDSRCL